MIHNPLITDLTELDDADGDCNFIMEFSKGNEGNVAEKVDRNLPIAAVELEETHLEHVVIGMDNNSVSTIGNDTMVSRRWNSRKTRVLTGSSQGSGIRLSEQSYTAMDSRVF